MLPRLKVRDPFAEIDSSDDLGRVGKMGPFVAASAVLRLVVYGLGAYWITLLVAPEEFGRLLQVGVPLALVALFGDFGLGDGIVRLKNLGPKLSSVFLYLNLGFSICVAGTLILVIPAFEIWFGGADLMDLGQVMAADVVVSGAASQYRALLRRQLRLKAIAGIEIVTSLSSNLIPIALALSGVGVIAIPLGRLGASIVALILMCFLTGWLPGRPARFAEAKSTLNFGFKLAASGMLHFGTSAVAALMIGRTFPDELLGFLERATALSKGIFDRLSNTFGKIVFPVIARSRHGEPEQFQQLVKTILQFLSIIAVVPLAVIASLSTAVVPVLFGAEFLAMGQLMALQWAVLLFAFIALFLALAMLAAGRSGLLFKVNLGRFIVDLAILGVFVVWMENLYAYIAVRAITDCVAVFVVAQIVSRVIGLHARVLLIPIGLALGGSVGVGILLHLTVEHLGLTAALPAGVVIILACAAIPVVWRRYFIESLATANRDIEMAVE